MYQTFLLQLDNSTISLTKFYVYTECRCTFLQRVVLLIYQQNTTKLSTVTVEPPLFEYFNQCLPVMLDCSVRMK